MILVKLVSITRMDGAKASTVRTRRIFTVEERFPVSPLKSREKPPPCDGPVTSFEVFGELPVPPYCLLAGALPSASALSFVVPFLELLLLVANAFCVLKRKTAL